MNRLPLAFIVVMLCVAPLTGADANALLESIKQRMQSVSSYTADVKIHVDISFMNVPDVKAKVTHVAPNNTKIEAPGFAMLPKQGADLSALRLLSRPYVAVDAGIESFQGVRMRKIKVIPADDEGDIAVATLLIDTTLMVPRKISTTSKTGGTAVAELVYDNAVARAVVLPSYIKLMFEIGKFDLPKTMTGDFDKKGEKEKGQKGETAVVEMWYTNYAFKTIPTGQ